MPRKYIDVSAMNSQEFVRYTKRDKLAGLATVDPNRDMLSLETLQAADSSAEGTIREKVESEKALAEMLPMENGEVNVESLARLVGSGEASEYQKDQYKMIVEKFQSVSTKAARDEASALDNMLPMQNGEIDMVSLEQMVKSGRASDYQKQQYDLMIKKFQSVKSES